MKNESRDHFGIICLLLSIVLYVFAIIFFVSPLPRKADTFIVVTWLFGPAIVGSILYIRNLAANRWGSDIELK